MHDRSTPSSIEERVKQAIESGDLDQYQELLDPQVKWGPPDDPNFGCQNRNQVLDWWRASREAGASAKVTEIIARDDHLLVGLIVAGTDAARSEGGTLPRWQVLSLRNGRIADIRGYESRDEAAAKIGLPVR